MRKNSGALLPLLILAAWLSEGCSKWETPSWDIGVAAPLVMTVLDVGDIIPDTLSFTDANNLVYLDFSHKVYTLSQGDLLDMEQPITDLAYNIPFTIMLNPGQAFISTLEETTFSFGDAEIRTIVIDRGTILLTLLNPLQERVVCEYSLPASSRNGAPLSIHATVPAATGAIPGTTTKVVDISGYTIDMTGGSGFAANLIRVQINTRIDPTGQPVQVTPFDTLKIKASFDELILKEAYGYFGEHLIETGLQSTRLDLFDLVTQGSLSPDTISARIRLRNGAGIDLTVKISELTARNSKENNSVSLTDPFIGVPINVGRAFRNPASGAITPTEHTITFDPATTKQMFSIFPDHLDWELDMAVNPLGNVSMGNDFLSVAHPVEAWFELLIPMRVNINNLTLRQLLDFYFSSSGVQSGTLYLIADNRFPFDATISLTLLDDLGTPIDSIHPAGTIAAAIQPATGAPQHSRTILTIPVGPDRLDALTRARKIDLEVVMNTVPAGGFVSLRGDDHMKLVISANMQTTISP